MKAATRPALFTPLALRGTTLKKRAVVSPMCQYSATEGMAGDWHFANLTKFALGGAAVVFTEAAAVEPEGRIPHGCAGLWNDDLAAPWKPIAAFLKAHNRPGTSVAAHHKQFLRPSSRRTVLSGRSDGIS